VQQDTLSHRPGDPDTSALAAFLDENLNAEGRSRMIRHLADCRECRSVVSLTARARHARFVFSPVAGLLAAAAALLVAAWLGVRITSEKPSEGRSPAAPAPAAPTAAPAPSEVGAAPAPAVSAAPRHSSRPPELHRSGRRVVAGKSFDLIAGEWVDREFDPSADLPVVRVATPEERREVLSRIPDLGPWASLGSRVVVLYRGTVYRFEAPSP